MSVDVGQPAPSFTLSNQYGESVSLGDYRGKKNVVLMFYPFAFSGLCDPELCEVRDEYAIFEDAGTQVLAISCDAMYTQKQWATERGFAFPVLTDFWPHGAVASAYGVFDDAAGCTNRCSFVINGDGIVTAVLETEHRGIVRTRADYEAALATLA
jgi:peroxiredoxin